MAPMAQSCSAAWMHTARGLRRGFCGGLLGHLDELDVLAKERVHQDGEVDALGVGESCEAALHFRLQIHRQVEGGARPVELAARAAGEVDLGGHLVIRWSRCVAHDGAYRGSSSYCCRSRRVASRAEMI